MIYALIAMSLIYPLVAILAYRQGVRDGKSVTITSDLPPILPPIPSKQERQEAKAARELEDMVRARIQEIDEYQP